MKKVVVYFSDITWTVVGNKENTDFDYQCFNQLLSRIKCHDEVDEVIFSLVSTDNHDSVFNLQHVMTPFIGQTVTYGKQFFGDGYYVDDKIVLKRSQGKAIDIMEYIKELAETVNISSVYYADDDMISQAMLAFLMADTKRDILLYQIEPKEHIGLSEVNQLLDEVIPKKFWLQKYMNYL